MYMTELSITLNNILGQYYHTMPRPSTTQRLVELKEDVKQIKQILSEISLTKNQHAESLESKEKSE